MRQRERVSERERERERERAREREREREKERKQEKEQERERESESEKERERERRGDKACVRPEAFNGNAIHKLSYSNNSVCALKLLVYQPLSCYSVSGLTLLVSAALSYSVST